MKKTGKHNPSTDPQKGDVMEWKGYVIEVTAVADGIVEYYVCGKGAAPRISQQDLAAWSHWTPEAKLREPGECTVLTMGCGACSKCGKPMSPVHYANGALTCAKCCTGTHKETKRSRLDQKAMV